MPDYLDALVAQRVRTALQKLADAAEQNDSLAALEATNDLERAGVSTGQVNATLRLCQAEVEAGFKPVIEWEVENGEVRLEVHRGDPRQ